MIVTWLILIMTVSALSRDVKAETPLNSHGYLNCQNLMSGSASPENELEVLMQLGLDRGWIDEQFLNVVLSGLEKTEFQGSVEYKLWLKAFESLVARSGGFTQDLSIKVARQLLDKLNRNSIARLKTEVSSKEWRRKPRFVSVRPRPVSIEGGPKRFSKSFRLKQAFEIMDRPVTLDLWEKVMGRRPDGPRQEPLKDRPPEEAVREISWASSLVFANRFSQMNGFPEIYAIDFSNSTGDAARGTLILGPRRKGLVKVIALDGEIYRASGFRLPTSAELVSILMHEELLPSFSELTDPVSTLELDRIAGPFPDRSENMPEVAAFEPMLLGDQELYNFLGLMEFWTQDSSTSSGTRILGESNPWNPDKGESYFRFGVDRDNAFMDRWIPLIGHSVHSRRGLGRNHISLILVRSRPDIWKEK